jgi:hypothetical protein
MNYQNINSEEECAKGSISDVSLARLEPPAIARPDDNMTPHKGITSTWQKIPSVIPNPTLSLFPGPRFLRQTAHLVTPVQLVVDINCHPPLPAQAGKKRQH